MLQNHHALIFVGVLMLAPQIAVADNGGLPPLVGLDGAPKNKELVVGGKQPNKLPQVAIMEPQLGPGIKGKVGRRFLKRLAKAMDSTKRLAPALQPTHLRSALSLEDQARLLACASKECVQTLSQLVRVQLVLVVSIRNVARAPLAIVRALAPDGSERFVHRQALPGGQLKPDTAVVLANRVVSVVERWKPTTPAASKPEVPPTEPVNAVTKAVEGPKQSRWLKSVGFGIGLGGVGLIGSSYATLNSAQQSFDARPITRDSVDTLAAAEARARLLWGTGLALGGLSVVSLTLSP
ncbi:MAG: hypothetical protein VX405_05700 [Myxococcota bacterium]|nr:hypothetical protein [Myxococcota bacterium]